MGSLGPKKFKSQVRHMAKLICNKFIVYFHLNFCDNSREIEFRSHSSLVSWRWNRATHMFSTCFLTSVLLISLFFLILLIHF